MKMRRLALITGGTSGIGFGAATALAADHDLALGFANDEAKAQAALERLRALAPQTETRLYPRTLRGHAEALALVDQVTRDFGRAPLVLVNSAGRIDDALFMEAEFERVQALIEEHLIVTMALAHAALKAMYREKFGRIVNLSSISAHYAKRGQSAYAAAKAGVEGFTRTLALEVAHRGVTVNAVAPGLIDTPMTEKIIAALADPKDIRKRVPAGYAGSPGDVGELIAFLCSERARYITGQVVTVDGGRSLGDPSS